MKEKKIKNSIIIIKKGDITNQKTEAIVNAANNRLSPGGGVSGAIHRAAGKKLWEECKTLHGCETGEAKITKGYNLKANYVIHTVGPVFSGSNKDKKDLKSCYNNCLQLAYNKKINSISFPAISTGIFKYPIKDAALIALQNVKDWLQKKNTEMLVQFILYDDKTLHIFENVFEEIN
jgi:O-acetyl-ADP-ribose deacetylase (regulator of RNase III)